MRIVQFLLPAAATAASILEERQAGGAPVASITELKAQFRPGARRHLTKYGPYTIRAAPPKGTGKTGAKGGKGGKGGILGGMGDPTLGGQAFFMSLRKGLCNDIGKGPCSVVAGRVGVSWVDGRVGDPSNGIYIHHILSSDNSKKEKPWVSSCGSPNRPPPNVAAITGGAGFLGTGEDGSAAWSVYGGNDTAKMGEGGYHIGTNDVFTAWAQLVNYNPTPAQVYLTYDVEWVPGNKGDDIKGVTLSATCGGGMIKMSNSGPTNTTSGKFYMMEDGRILGGRGHLHDGGTTVKVLHNGKFLCDSAAVYGSKAESGAMGGMGGHSHGGAGEAKSPAGAAEFDIKTISSMTDCVGPYPVKKGDYIVLVAEYDLKKHPLRKSVGGHDAADVMGMMGLTFATGPGTVPIAKSKKATSS